MTQPKFCAGSSGTKDSPPGPCVRNAKVFCPKCGDPLCLNHAKTITNMSMKNRTTGLAGKRRCARCGFIDFPAHFAPLSG